jgi:hypothetical protein
MRYNYTETTLQATKDLILAVRKGDLENAKVAIQNGANVNCRITREFTIATPEQLKMTLKSNGHPNIPKDMARPGGSEVIMAGTTTLLNILARTEDDRPEHLKKALPTKMLPIAALLMENGAELGAIDYASYWERWGDSAENYFQNTPLLNAIVNGDLEFAQLYMSHLAKLDLASRREILNYKDRFSAGFHTALEFSIRRGYTGLATSIVRAGADVNPEPFIFSYAGKSPLHMACMLLGNSFDKGQWDEILGSDLELVITLIESGADYAKSASTSVYYKPHTDPRFLPLRETREVTPFDHIDVASDSLTQRPFDYFRACTSPAFGSPLIEKVQLVGQIVHPFHEEACFLTPLAARHRSRDTRQAYLQSPQYLNRDKSIIQKALIKRMIKDYQNTHPEDDQLVSIDVDKGDILQSITLLLEHPAYEWFAQQLQLASIIYNADKTIPPQPPIQNSARNTINAPSNYFEPSVTDLSMFSMEAQAVVSSTPNNSLGNA